MQHRPKPWKAGKTLKYCVYDKDSNFLIADCELFRNGSNLVEEERANAHLIAAAPELLDALKKLISPAQFMADSHEHTPGRAKQAALFDKAVEEAMAAIEKAEGK